MITLLEGTENVPTLNVLSKTLCRANVFLSGKTLVS